ncbi:MAG: GIY-YIG nuclease family protein [Sphingobacteriaceae bacterium]|nr:GIY-YIG nuclease family protein [Cytophagaceae bacterium]
MHYGGTVYILTNRHRSTLYVGVTADLAVRLQQHRDKQFPDSFTARYNLDELVYYENFSRIEEAISREKQLKAGSRTKKEALIDAFNPEWKDLSEEVLAW